MAARSLPNAANRPDRGVDCISTARDERPAGLFTLAWILWCVLGSCELSAQRRAPDLEALPFAPRKYVSYRAPSRITIDGKLDEPAWSAAAWTDALNASDIHVEGLEFRPVIHSTPTLYEISADGFDGALVHINQEGRVWLTR